MDPLFQDYSGMRKQRDRFQGIVRGSGGDGGVIRGVERKSREWHALKFIPTKAHDPSGARERALLARLQHPNVVKLLRCYEPAPERPRTVLVMPEADFTLYQYINRSRGRTRPPESVGIDIAAQLSEGLAFLHHNSVVHRDLKPDNVLMMVQPHRLLLPCRIAGCGEVGYSGMSVLLADFSRACCIDEAKLEGGMSTSMCAYGYCAPEHLAEGSVHRPYAPAFDVWSLGATLYELATTEPFVATSMPASCPDDQTWASVCVRARLGRQPLLLCPVEAPEVQVWQHSCQAAQCSAVLLQALEAAIQWDAKDRVSAANTVAILTARPTASLEVV